MGASPPFPSSVRQADKETSSDSPSTQALLAPRFNPFIPLSPSEKRLESIRMSAMGARGNLELEKAGETGSQKLRVFQ